jgi:predicted adenine nucleotide alpha hydrolase (AANH) superfamily ATPase
VLKPPWATAAAMSHGEWMSKVQNFQAVVFGKNIFKKYKKVFAKIFLKNIKKILQQEYCKCEQYLASAAFYSQSCIQTRGLQPISYTIQ